MHWTTRNALLLYIPRGNIVRIGDDYENVTLAFLGSRLKKLKKLKKLIA
jgi:hypothetical protein